MKRWGVICAAMVLCLSIGAFAAEVPGDVTRSDATEVANGQTVSAPDVPTVEEGSVGWIQGDLTVMGLPGIHTARVVWGDYDQDGDADMAIVGSVGPDFVTRVYRNDGSARFSAAAGCVTVNGVTTCEGDQSAGVVISSSSPVVLWVQNLTSDIKPTEAPGIDVQVKGSNGSKAGAKGADGPAAEVHFLGSGHAIVIAPPGGFPGISVQSTAGNGQAGSGAGLIDPAGAGGAGGRGGDVVVDSRGVITVSGDQSPAIFAESQGGQGGSGGSGGALHDGARGGQGGDGGAVSVSGTQDITTDGTEAYGIAALSQGGTGGNAGNGAGKGGVGGAGGFGGSADILGGGSIETHGDQSSAIVAESAGGKGGSGGTGGVKAGGTGGKGGDGGAVGVSGSQDIITDGSEAHGITALSQGGKGGNAGSSDAANGGTGGVGGSGGVVNILGDGVIETNGDNSHGIYARSEGGLGGNGGKGGVFGSGNGGAGGGHGGDVTVDGSWSITTHGTSSDGISAHSLGGGGGKGGHSGWFGDPGEGGQSGYGGQVTVNNHGSITTTGDSANGILAQSVGGYAGTGGTANVFVGFNANGGSGGNGGVVTVNNEGTIATAGDASNAILAQSIGGGGGSGGSGFSLFYSEGGEGSAGGSGDSVIVNNSGTLTVTGVDSRGIFAQSVGGGGGNGGSSGGIASFGGRGAVTSDGGDVVVVNSGTINTGVDVEDEERPEGETGSQAIFAQSIGGGGGNGGQSGGWFSVGGSGGGGGDAGTVSVTNTGTLHTRDDNSSAIFAQSVGGGGGNGGASGSVSGALASVAIGGKGAGGGDGESVDVSTSGGQVITEGDYSNGIFAQSVGGGGGNGGFAISASAINTPVSVAIGGKAGPGGNAGTVNVQSESAILTSGSDAHGIVAQSVGGGGGTGGFAVAASMGGSVSWNLAIGGDGNDGGHGNVVNVGTESDRLGGSITTTGDRSYGIMAQSIGGGGGSGGFAITGALFSGATVGLGLGGKGKSGGHGDAVNIFTDANITTTGAGSYGILAQSIGGGGGAGGWSLSAGLTAFGGATFSLGGEGGPGSTGGTVDLVNGGTIVTTGDYSSAIMAQSIGGGGGAGGMSGTAMVNFSGLVPLPPDVPEISANFGVSMGGKGGSGATGGEVNVTNEGKLVTTGDFSHAIVAQSIGGGGGAGGQAIAATGNIGFPFPDPPGTSVQVDVALALGGSGGTGNNGGAVTVNNEDSIITTGDGSYGILAQSIGGGGGIGGNARAMTLNVDPSEWAGGVFKTPDSLHKEISVTADIAIGGKGKAGGNGGTVSVVNDGNIITGGADAHGIVAQSIGGGGGAGGGGYHGMEWSDLGVPDELMDQFVSSDPGLLEGATVVIGGKGGASGNAANVDVANTGTVRTFGDGSFGILAQSIGAGGGTGGLGSQGSGTVGVGGGGGGAGDGGDVTVSSTGTIETQGTSAHAIFAQSIGGGGGIGGNVDRGTLGFGINVAIGQNGGSAGDGGMVNVDVLGDIITHGAGSNGIFAQSVGGGGGLAGDVGTFLGFAGSAGGDGSGGEVHVTLDGSITTYGDASHGIVAQSAGGANDAVYVTETASQEDGVSSSRCEIVNRIDESSVKPGELTEAADTKTIRGSDEDVSDAETGAAAEQTSVLLPDRADVGSAVTVDVDGDVLTYGKRSDGIVAQSVGDDGNGNITVNIYSGTVQGGTGDGVGVRVLDGADNLVSNHGTITTVSGVDGMAIWAAEGNEVIDNFGTVTGSVDLGDGTNSFANRAGATFNAGSVIDLGANGVLTNDGIFSPGGADAELTTTFTGQYVQTEDGTFELSVCGDAYDQLQLTSYSTAALDGTLKIVAECDAYTDGMTYDIVHAAGAQQITGAFSDIDLPQTAFLDFSADNVGGNVRLTVDVKDFAVAAPDPVCGALADYMDACRADATGDMAHMIGAFQLATPEQVADAFQTLSPDTYDNLTRGELQSVQLYQDALALRMDAARFSPFVAKESPGTLAFMGGNGWWLSGLHHGADQDASGGYLAHNFTTSGVLGGYERSNGSAMVGGSLGGTQTDVDRDNDMANGKVKGWAGSVYGGRLWGRNYGLGVLSYVHNSNENRRDIVVGTERREANSDYSGSALSALITCGRRLDSKQWGIEPFASLRYMHLSEDAFTETGAGAVNLVVDSRSTDWLGSDLGVRLSRSFTGEHSAWVPELLVAWNHDFGLDDRQLVAAFEGDPMETFTITGQNIKTDGATLGVGLNFLTTAGWRATLRYDRVQRSDYQANNVTLRLGSAF